MDFFPRDSTSPTNFLFRGNMPVVNGSFAYREVVSTMADLIKLAGFTMPQNSLFLDFRCACVTTDNTTVAMVTPFFIELFYPTQLPEHLRVQGFGDRAKVL